MPHCLATRHIPCEDLGIYEPLLRRLGYTIEYVDMDGTAPPPAALERLAEADVAIVLGGPMAVYEADQYPFLARELELLRERLAHRQPTLGICLGSQLIAGAAGARVYPSGRRELGWYPIEFTAEAAAHRLFGLLIPPATAGAAPSGPFFHWHGDTFELPVGAQRIGGSARCVNQGFWLAEPGAPPHAIAFQFHAEVDGAVLEQWLDVYAREGETGDLRPGEGVMSVEQLRAGAREHGPALCERSTAFLAAWLHAIAASI